MALIVQKFGGSSVGDVDCIRRVAARIAKRAKEGNQIVVVVSAMGKTTDVLINLAHELNPNPSAREMDMLLSTGEQQSIALLAMTLNAMGCPAISLTGEQAGVHTDFAFARAKILGINPTRLRKELAEGKVIIVAGFQGVDEFGDIHTLGRGGSDTSAVALAVGLEADFCEIYTDVNGVYTADPRICKNARKLEVISFDEMLEMASLGSGVLQPRSVEVGKKFNMPICVRSSFNEKEGTMVQEVDEMKDLECDVTVSGVAYDDDVLQVTIYDVPDKSGVASRLFTRLAEEKINVDMIIQSGHNENVVTLSFTTNIEFQNTIEAILPEIIEEIGAQGFAITGDIAKVSIVGVGMISNPGVAAKMFQVLSDNNFNIYMISTSEIKVSCIVDKANGKEAVCALHEAFELGREEIK